MLNKIYFCDQHFLTVTINSQIKTRGYKTNFIYKYNVHVITAKQEKLGERVRQVLTCNLHVKVRVPGDLLNLLITALTTCSHFRPF